eukprot:COSAG05_NODE_2326_length_3231_cov_38.996096_4_plen_180_part_00
MDLTQSQERAAGVGLGWAAGVGAPPDANPADGASDAADIAYSALFSALRDPVPHVYAAALTVLRVLAANPGKLPTKDAGATVLCARIVRAVVAKLGDRNARTRTRTETALVELARLPVPYGPSEVARPLLGECGKPAAAGEEGEKSKDSMSEARLKLLSTLIQVRGHFRTLTVALQQRH